MSEGGGGAGRYSAFESDCLKYLESQAAKDTLDSASSTSWNNFECCATAVANLYRHPEWGPFQTAAKAATQLYKDYTDSHRRGYECGVAAGRQRYVKELVAFVKTSKAKAHYIRREELIAFLAGCQPPSKEHRTAGRGGEAAARSAGTGRGGSSRSAASAHQQHQQQAVPPAGDNDTAFVMFHEALKDAVEASAGGRDRSQWAGREPSAAAAASGDLSSFLLDELRRNRKRKRNLPDGSSSPMEMSPTVDKRSKQS